MQAIAFCERESDNAPMTILQDGDRLVARRRLLEDSITPSFRVGAHNDLWLHVRSGGRYLRHDEVLDLETGEICYDYSSFTDGRLWLRSVAAWHEIVEGHPRFIPVGHQS